MTSTDLMQAFTCPNHREIICLSHATNGESFKLKQISAAEIASLIGFQTVPSGDLK